MKIKDILQNAILIIFGLLIALLLTETTLRLTVYNYPNYPVSPGPGSTYEINTPEFKTRVRINSLNLRGGEVPDKKLGQYRILCVGDSFTFGLGLNEEETYPHVLQTLLAHFNKNISVVNNACGRYAKEQYEFLSKKGLGLQPDLVVVQIYIRNDFYDPQIDFPHGERDSKQPPRASHPGWDWGWLKVFIKEKCVTLDFIWRQLLRVPYVDRWLFGLNLRYNDRGIYLKEYPAFEKRLVGIELEYLNQLDAWLIRNSIDRVYLIAPSREQVTMKEELSRGLYDYQKPNRILREFFEQKGAPVIDLLEIYEQLPADQTRAFYYLQDGHWTSRGARHAAEVVSDWVQRRLSKG